MKPGILPGAAGTLTWVVDASTVITLGGDPRATVFSTPNMILLMERSAKEVLRPFLDAGEESVGTSVNIQHVGSAGLGEIVTGAAKLSTIDGRKFTFEIEARCGDRVIGYGTHTRAVIALNRLIDNLAILRNEDPRAMTLRASSGALPPFQTLMVEITGRVATVTLNRPRSLNAVNMQMTGELEQVVSWLMGHPEDVRVVLLTGAGTAFSSRAIAC